MIQPALQIIPNMTKKERSLLLPEIRQIVKAMVKKSPKIQKRHLKQVIGINIKTGEEINYPSIVAVKRDGFRSDCVSKACRKIVKKHRGYYWSFCKL